MPSQKDSRFEGQQGFQVIESSPPGQPEIRVLKLDGGLGPQVSDFVAPAVSNRGRGDYSAIRAKFGPLAATDPSRASKTRKDSRFTINELSRGPLAVEEEERRAIDERVQEEVNRVIEEVKSAAQAEGYQVGMRKGHDEAFSKYVADGSAQLARFEAFVNACEQAKNEIFAANERFLIDLVYRIAGVIALKEIREDPQYLGRLCKELIERVGVRENIRIRVHPDQLKNAMSLKGSLEESFGKLNNLTFEPSSEVISEGCLVETQWNSIDATLERQLAGFRSALMGAPLPESGGEGATS